VGVKERVKGSAEARKYSVLDNYRLMFTDKRLRLVALGLIIGQMSVLMIEPIFALFIEGFKIDTEYIATVTGAIFSIAGLFMIISAPFWGKRNDRRGYKTNMSASLAVVAVAYSCHALVGSLLQLGFLRAVLGFFRGGILPGLYSLTSLYSPPERRGGMMAIASSLTLLGNMLGPMLGGFIGGHFGIKASFMVNSILLMMLALVFWNTLEEPDKQVAESGV